MINVKGQKKGSSNNAVAAINALYNDYVIEKEKMEKSFVVVKICYDFVTSKRDAERKIVIKGAYAYCLEEVDFSNGYIQDHRNWSPEFNARSGRLQISKTFIKDNSLPAEDISYEQTKNFISKMYNQKNQSFSVAGKRT